MAGILRAAVESTGRTPDSAALSPLAAHYEKFPDSCLRKRGDGPQAPAMSADERRSGAKDERGLRVRGAAAPAERAEEHVELRRVLAGHAELVVRRPAEVEDLEHRLELRRCRGEVVGVGVRSDRYPHERLEAPAARARVHKRREARDHARVSEAPNAVGRGVCAEAHRRAEVAPGDAAVLAKDLEDLTVDLVHPRDYLS